MPKPDLNKDNFEADSEILREGGAKQTNFERLIRKPKTSHKARALSNLCADRKATKEDMLRKWDGHDKGEKRQNLAKPPGLTENSGCQKGSPDSLVHGPY